MYIYTISHCMKLQHFTCSVCFQDVAEAEGPVVEKIMGLRTAKKQVRDTECLFNWYTDFVGSSKKNLSTSQHMHAYIVASQLPMGYPPCTPHNSNSFSWPWAWHTVKTSVLAMPDTKFAFPLCARVMIHGITVEVWWRVCVAVVKVNEGGRLCYDELLFGYFSICTIWLTNLFLDLKSNLFMPPPPEIQY